MLTIIEKKVKGVEEKTKRDAELRTLIGGLIDYDDLAARSLGDHHD